MLLVLIKKKKKEYSECSQNHEKKVSFESNNNLSRHNSKFPQLLETAVTLKQHGQLVTSTSIRSAIMHG